MNSDFMNVVGNPVVLAIIAMIVMSLLRTPVIFAIILSAIGGGLYAGMAPKEVVDAFNGGLVNGAPVALAYAILGVFAVMLSRSGLTHKLSQNLIARFNADGTSGESKIKWAVYFGLIAMGFASQSIIPVHIAFIPILVPPLLLVMNHLQLDRRAVACVITFSITVMYMCAPVGFGSIYLNDILMANINTAGKELNLTVTPGMLPLAMLIPGLGMVGGLLFALLISYRKKRKYEDKNIEGMEESQIETQQLASWQVGIIIASLFIALGVQVWTGSMIFGGICGCAVMSLSKVFRWEQQDSIFIQGMRLLAAIGFIMIAANGFAGVMKATGAVPELVNNSIKIFGESQALAALVMLIVGLFITMGIGSSFSTVPIIAMIFVPLCISMNFSPLATIALVGTAGALGDAGSPASDSTLGPTAGLNADGQHDHIWDTVVPTFLHFNLPLIAAGWIAAMIL